MSRERMRGEGNFQDGSFRKVGSSRRERHPLGGKRQASHEIPITSGVVEFSNYKPTQLQEYQFPKPVTRNNFASTLARSFSISGGDSRRHILYLEFLKIQTGFNYESTLDNFIKNGGWNTFSQEEKQLFMKSFNSVKRHRTTGAGKVWQNMHNDPITQLNLQLEDLIGEVAIGYFTESEELLENFTSRYGSLTTMTQKEFFTHLNQIYPLRAKEE